MCELCIMNVFCTILCYSFEGSLFVNEEIELDYTALKNYWIFMIDYAYEDF